MYEISELDLQNLRHLIGGFSTTHCKMQAYAQQAQDHTGASGTNTVRPRCAKENAQRSGDQGVYQTHDPKGMSA